MAFIQRDGLFVGGKRQIEFLGTLARIRQGGQRVGADDRPGLVARGAERGQDLLEIHRHFGCRAGAGESLVAQLAHAVAGTLE